MSLFAADPAAHERVRTRSATATARRRSLADLAAGEVYLDRDAADALDARAGDRLRLLAGGRAEAGPRRGDRRLRRRRLGRRQRAAAARSRRRRCSGATARSSTLLVSNRGDETGGAALTDDVLAAAGPATRPHWASSCEDGQAGRARGGRRSADVFISVFTTFGSFSIAAGILLIFLIFVMLSAERRSELGIARAIGTRREHLVQMFVVRGPRL